ncbi:thioesterase II family protein [Streptomyces sp. NPDC001107]
MNSPAFEPDTTAHNPWVSGRFLSAYPGLRLICLPQSGGGAGAFSGWRPHLPPGVELVSVELPGRGGRGDEPLPDDFDKLADQLLDGISAELCAPYVLFGHSFGALLAYELTRRIERAALPTPQALLVSASRAPHVPPVKKVSERSDEALLEWLLKNDGMPRELLKYAAFVTYAMRAIRADLVLAETYAVERPDPVGCPLHAFGGSHDPVVPPTDLDAWRGYTTADFSVTVLPGGHAYPHTDPRAMFSAMAAALPGQMPAAAASSPVSINPPQR